MSEYSFEIISLAFCDIIPADSARCQSINSVINSSFSKSEILEPELCNIFIKSIPSGFKFSIILNPSSLDFVFISWKIISIFPNDNSSLFILSAISAQ